MTKYNKEQQALIDAPLDSTVVGIASAGSGKEQPLTEPILTPTGWTTMGQLSVGDKVVGSNGKPITVLKIFENGLKDNYKITFTDGTFTYCGLEHLWTFKNDAYMEPQTHTLSTWLTRDDLKGFYLPSLAPVEYTSKQVPIPAYLLGQYLLDSNALSQTHLFNKDYDKVAQSIIKLKLRVLNRNKFIPDIYKFASIEVRKELLNSLFDVNALVTNGKTQFVADSDQLVSDVAEVLRSLGIVCKLEDNLLEVPFEYNTNIDSFMQHYRRYVDKIEKVGQCDMRCIMIDAPDALYVTRHHILTHNTHTMLGRTQRILREYTTGRVLLISFTRMASNDLRQKLMRVIPEHEMRRIEVGTFHSVIGKLIRSNAVQVGLQPSVSIIDENSTNTMYRSIIENNPEHLRVAESWFVTPNHKKLVKRDFNKIAGTVSTLVNTAQPQELETGVFSKDTEYRIWKTDTQRINDSNLEEIISMLHKIFIESLKVSRETNTLNYDHILFIGYLMAKNGLLKSYADALVHVIVDEFQDTNALQDAFVRAIGKDKLTIIGDIDQSIYEFRGGRYELMEAHANEGHVVNLSSNYRSYQPILDIGNKIIAHNISGSKYRKPMHAAIATDEGFGGILYTKAYRDQQESDFVVNKIKYLIRQGVKPSEIAILVRSRMSIASINLALQRDKITVNDTTRFADFMNSDVMVDTLNFVKIFTNPKDVFAFMSILDRPARGIGPKAVDTLLAKAEEHKMGIIEFIMSEHVSELTPALRNKVTIFSKIYGKLIDPQITMTFPDMIDFLLQETGYVEWINSLKNNESHKRNLTILSGVVEDFVEEYRREHNQFSLYDIANAFTFEMSASTRQQDNDGVVIATIHGSKGLEWEHVFLLGMEQQGFPGNTCDEMDEESERRLAYVAVTRAKKSLTLCQSENRLTFGETILTKSQFLDEAELDQPKRL